MLDIKLLRTEKSRVEARLRSKDPNVNLSPILARDEKIRVLKTKNEHLKAERNHYSKQIGEYKRSNQDATALLEEVARIGKEIVALDDALAMQEEGLVNELSHLPNLPEEGIRNSLDPNDNVCIQTFGQKPTFSFPFKNHVELNDQLHLFDFKRGAKVTGSGWPVYRHLGAQLEWALLQFMIDVQIEHGFELTFPPLLVRQEILYGSGQLPKFEKQVFHLNDPDYPLFLIPTSEVVLNGLYFDEIFKEEELPKKLSAYTPCFRREAGAAGAQERGLIRMHQFNKVEMFAFATPTQSAEIFQQMLQCAEEILQSLNIHYREMLLVTGDISFAAAKTVDIEVWLPGQNRYYEVSSISHCTDYQARRSKIRYKCKEEKPEFVHTLNGSGLATSRLMVALLENHQREDGTVALPFVLHKYMNGCTELRGP